MSDKEPTISKNTVDYEKIQGRRDNMSKPGDKNYED